MSAETPTKTRRKRGAASWNGAVADDAPDTVVGLARLCRITGFSHEAIRQFAKQGIVITAGPGQYVQEPSIANLVSHLRGQVKEATSGVRYNLTLEKARKEKWQADQAELEFKRDSGQLVEVQAALAWMPALVTWFSTEIKAFDIPHALKEKLLSHLRNVDFGAVASVADSSQEQAPDTDQET